MAANPAQIRGELCNVSIRGADVIPITQSVERPASVDMGSGGYIRVARGEGSGSNFGKVGQMDRRSKYRLPKQAARLAAKGFHTVDDKLRVLDAPLLVGCIAFGLIYVVFG